MDLLDDQDINPQNDTNSPLAVATPSPSRRQ